MKTMRRPLAALLLTVAALSLTGCKSEFGEVRVDHAKLASALSDRLSELAGHAPDDVTCPKDLPGKVGASVRCTLTAGEDTYGVTVTTTKVEGKQVGFDLQVDREPLPR